MSLEARVPGIARVLLGRERVNESRLLGYHSNKPTSGFSFQSLPGQQLPTVAVPAAPSRGQEPQSPSVSSARRPVVPCWLSWHPSASEKKKGGNSVLGEPSPGLALL